MHLGLLMCRRRLPTIEGRRILLSLLAQEAWVPGLLIFRSRLRQTKTTSRGRAAPRALRKLPLRLSVCLSATEPLPLAAPPQLARYLRPSDCSTAPKISSLAVLRPLLTLRRPPWLEPQLLEKRACASTSPVLMRLPELTFSPQFSSLDFSNLLIVY